MQRLKNENNRIAARNHPLHQDQRPLEIILSQSRSKEE